MKAAFYILIIAFLQGSYGQQLDPVFQNVEMQEMNIYMTLPQYITSNIADFLQQVDSMFDSVMQASLQTANFDLICYLNSKQKYEPWYTNIAYQCMLDRNASLANLTFWHDNFVAALPELNQIYLDAVAAVQARSDCGPQDVATYTSTLGSNVTFPSYTFQQLSQLAGGTTGIVPINMLYSFNSELSMIFSYASSDPTFDAIGALEDAEFKHLTVDSMTIIDACEYSRWWYTSNFYAYYSTVLEYTRHVVVDALLRGSAAFVCTGQ